MSHIGAPCQFRRKRRLRPTLGWAVTLFLGFFLASPVEATEEEATGAPFFSSGEGLNISRAGAIRMPVFSSVDGYVVFRISAQKIEPAQRRVGVFSVPQHGYAMDSVRLDFLSGALSEADWANIIKICQSLQQIKRTGPIEVKLPDAQSVRTGDLLVLENSLLIRPKSTQSRTLLRLAREKESGLITYTTLKLKPKAQL